MIEGRTCLQCLEVLPLKKNLNTRYCSEECKTLANSHRARMRRYELQKDRSLILFAHKVWFFALRKKVMEAAPAGAIGFQLGATLLGQMVWFPHHAGRKKVRRTLAESWACAVDHFSLEPFEQPWVPKAGFYQLRYIVKGEWNVPPEKTTQVYVPYGVPIWDLPFDAASLETERK